MSRSFIDACIAVPWKLRLTSGLQRRIIYLLCPLAAKTQTTYGASATPVMPSTFHQHAWQAIRRFRHMAEKVTRVAINRNVGPQRADLAVVKYDSPDFRAFVEPSQMVSRALYRSEPFSQLMTAPERWSGQKSMVARMATIEQICREVNCQPSAGLLD
jgi:hypothetical protein